MSDSPLAAVCTVSLLALLLVCFVPFGHALGSNGRLRSRLIPRYIAEKEIRGPTYHVIHNMRLDEDMENYRRDSVRKGPSYVQRQRQKLKGRQDTRMSQRQLQWTEDSHSDEDLDSLPVSGEEEHLRNHSGSLTYHTTKTKFNLHPRIKQDFGSQTDEESIFSVWLNWLWPGDSESESSHQQSSQSHQET